LELSIRQSKLQSSHHHQQTNKQVVTDWMSFLTLSQQCQSIECRVRWTPGLQKLSSCNASVFFQRDYIINIINCRNPLWMQDKFVGVKCRLQERDYCQLTCFVDIFCNWLCTSFICILVTLLLSRISEHSTFARYFVSRFSGIY